MKEKSDQILKLLFKLETQSDLVAGKVIAKLVKLGPKVLPFLLKAAQNKNAPRIRKWSMQALGCMGSAKSLPVLIEALDDERMTARLHALKALAKIKSKKSTKKICKLLFDQSGGVRVNALYALICIEDSASHFAIKECLNDSAWYVRQVACVACEELQVKGSQAKLKKLSTTDPRKAVRDAAISTLQSFSAKPK